MRDLLSKPKVGMITANVYLPLSIYQIFCRFQNFSWHSTKADFSSPKCLS